MGSGQRCLPISARFWRGATRVVRRRMPWGSETLGQILNHSELCVLGREACLFEPQTHFLACKMREVAAG